ncbi:MAG: ABC transporter permease [Lachnospiraceae bacterium]|nr:ABC transporter permease [Lachnospiraceae bacterium]
MTKYILKRILYMVVVFFIVSFVMYFLFNLIPSDPARLELEEMKKTLRPDVYEKMYRDLRESMGLDDPIIVRYARWLGVIPEKSGEFNGYFQANFGYSNFYKKPVVNVISAPIRTTVFMNIFATILALGITIPLGIWCAVHKGSRRDNFVQVFSIVGYSIPIYIIALVFIYVFAVLLRWFPVSGIGTPGANYTGLRAFLDELYYLGLPLIVMTFASLGGMSRYVRSAMIEALSMDHIRTARAKGVKERVVIYSHAWRNALLPVVTLIISWFLGIFSGSVLVESTFGISGMGRLYIQSLSNHDFEVSLFVQMFYTVVSLVGALLMDLIYGFVDPRIRVNK